MQNSVKGVWALGTNQLAASEVVWTPNFRQLAGNDTSGFAANGYCS